MIMHDANHHAFAPRRSVNRVMALSLDLIGGSSYVWSAKHLAHHTYPNVTDHDPDIDALPFARFDPAQARRSWHRYQHLYLWLFYMVITLRWQFITDFTFLRAGRAGAAKLRPPRGWAMASLIAGKLVFVTWAIGIPLLLHPVLPVAGVFLLTSAVASLTLTTVFQLSHCVEEAEFVDPLTDDRTRTWQVHQVESTVDFAHGNRLLSLYVGGLNHQIEHHLYSRLPHTLYDRDRGDRRGGGRPPRHQLPAPPHVPARASRAHLLPEADGPKRSATGDRAGAKRLPVGGDHLTEPGRWREVVP